MPRLYQFLKSVKLAIVLLVVMALISVLATLIPQNRELAFYYHSYSQVLTWLVLSLGLNSSFLQKPFSPLSVRAKVRAKVRAIFGSDGNGRFS